MRPGNTVTVIIQTIAIQMGHSNWPKNGQMVETERSNVTKVVTMDMEESKFRAYFLFFGKKRKKEGLGP